MLKDLDAWIADLRSHRDQLAAELDRVDAALAALSGDTHAAKRQPDAGHREGSASPMVDLLNAMFEEHPDEEFTAETALETLKSSGWESDAVDPVNAMRTALSRMAKRGEIHRVGRGKYRKEAGVQPDPEPQPETDEDSRLVAPDPWATPADDGDDEPPF